MADIADRGSAYEEADRERAIAAARQPLPKGRPGECDLCGEWSGRLVEGVCAPCRDIEATRRARRIGR